MAKCDEILKPGDVVKEKYEVLRRVGGGGQSCVYLGKNRENEESVIIKLLMFQSYSKKAREEELKLFSREAHIFERIQHPLIPRLYDFFEEDGKHFIVEEYVEGKCLEKVIKSNPNQMESQQVLRFLSDTLDLLITLHNQDPPIIVRDIKPGNIIIDSNGNPHIIDFTIAREHTPGKSDTVRMGSPGYAPPEQYKGSTDPRSDIYALGATAYQMITRFDPSNKPFAFPEILETNKNADRDLAKIIDKATSMDPEERYQAADEMKSEVDRVLEGYKNGNNHTNKIKNAVTRLAPIVSTLIVIFFISIFFIAKWEEYSTEKQASLRNAGLCYRNLARISTALDNYAKDNEGNYPQNLDELVPKYMDKIPLCPQSGTDTYSVSYRIIEMDSSEAGGDKGEDSQQEKIAGYIIYCKGHHHKEAGIEPDHPYFEKGKGLE